MYQHHRESLGNLKNYFADKEEVIAVIFGSSVAKGCERPDSDLDAMVVVTEEEYEIRQRENRTAETIEGHCTYQAPTEIGSVLSRYTTDFEQWWRVPRPNINEW